MAATNWAEIWTKFLSLQILDFLVFKEIYVLEINANKYYYWVNSYNKWSAGREE